MSEIYQNNCDYCKHTFCWKYLCRTLNDVFAIIEERISLENVKSIDFTFKGKKYIISESCELRNRNNLLCIEFVEPLTKGNCDSYYEYHFPSKITQDRDLKLLRHVEKRHLSRDLMLTVSKYATIKKNYHSCTSYTCVVRKIEGRKNIHIWLEDIYTVET